MTPLRSSAFPIQPYQLHNNSQPNFGQNPFRRNGLAGCGCGPTKGCGCSPGLSGLRAVSLDQIISDVFNFGSSAVQSQLPSTAAVPPGYSPNAMMNSLIQYAPYIIGGYLLYKFLK